MSPFVRPPSVRHHDRVTARSVLAILLVSVPDTWETLVALF